MENDLPTSTYIKIAVTIILLPIVLILIFAYGDDLIMGISNTFEEMTIGTKIKNTEITQENYKEVYALVNDSTEITLQEKKNFNENYLIFGKKIIGYKVKDVLKEIE